MRGPATAIVLVLSTILAGCTGAGTEPKSTLDTAQVTLDGDTSMGLVTGLITDDESQPLAATDVGLRGTQLRSVTDAQGRFRLGPAEPGTYTLDAARIGFEPVARQVEVSAGQETDVSLRLVPLPDPAEVFYEVSHFTAFYDCALGAVVWVSACSYPYTAAYLTLEGAGVNLTETAGVPADVQRNEFRYNFTVAPEVVDIVSEAEWQAASAASRMMQLILSCANYDPVLDDCPDANSYAEAEGESPIRAAWKASVISARPDWVMTRIYLPFLEPQLAVSQRVELWNTLFYNGEAPEGFTVVESD